MTKASKIDYAKIDINELLEQRRQIAIIWSTDDVQNVRPDLTDDQAWEVLQECQNRQSCDIGFTWDSIQDIADELFPDLGDRS